MAKRSGPRMDHRMAHQWHVAINGYHEAHRGERRHWMYEAKTMADEVPRLALLFGRERCGELVRTHRQCSLSPSEPVPENFLTCCLGVRCSECVSLKALDAAEMPPEQIDEAKAWTCATHIVSQGGDQAGEGYVLTVDDRMYWDNLYRSLAGGPPA